MPLLDLSLVTEAILKLLEQNVTNSPAWTPANVLTPLPQPPDKLKGDWALGFYLYHLREEAHTKSQDWPVDDDVPQRFAPMGLALYYVLTAHSDLGDQTKQVFAEQLMMGLAVKTLRDYPRLDDTTTVGGVSVFPNGLKGHDNVLRLLLQPIQFSEAMQYWTAGQQPLRLAAYYEVSATLLEPEPLTSKRGRVLAYGVHTFLRGSPRLDGSRNRIQFTIPGETAPRELELQPAEVTYGATVTFFGSDLRGDRTALILDNARRFTDPVTVDPIAWGVAATGSEVTATIQQVAAPETVLPGLYGATVLVVTRKTMPDGSTREFEMRSNETPFAIAPRITAIAPGATWQVTGDRFDPATLTGDAVRMFVGPDRLTRIPAGNPAAGQFRVMNATTLRFRPPAGLAPGTVLPLRIIVDGAESAPAWITIP